MGDFGLEKSPLKAKVDNLDEITRNVALEMFNKSELFWKLLKYNTPDAYAQDDLTASEKSALMSQGETTARFIFKGYARGEVITDERTEVRLYIDRIRFITNAEVELYFGIDLVIHNSDDMWFLDNGTNRANMLMKELVSVLHENRVNKVVGALSVIGTTAQKRVWDENYEGFKMSITATTT